MSGTIVPDYIAEAITEQFGERCEEFAAGCACCEAWSQYDDLVSLRAQVDNADAAIIAAEKRGEERGMRRAAEKFDAICAHANEHYKGCVGMKIRKELRVAFSQLLSQSNEGTT
jgi:hypothetical protein